MNAIALRKIAGKRYLIAGICLLAALITYVVYDVGKPPYDFLAEYIHSCERDEMYQPGYTIRIYYIPADFDCLCSVASSELESLGFTESVMDRTEHNTRIRYFHHDSRQIVLGEGIRFTSSPGQIDLGDPNVVAVAVAHGSIWKRLKARLP
jgi:hypothetical protein